MNKIKYIHNYEYFNGIVKLNINVGIVWFFGVLLFTLFMYYNISHMNANREISIINSSFILILLLAMNFLLSLYPIQIVHDNRKKFTKKEITKKFCKKNSKNLLNSYRKVITKTSSCELLSIIIITHGIMSLLCLIVFQLYINKVNYEDEIFKTVLICSTLLGAFMVFISSLIAANMIISLKVFNLRKIEKIINKKNISLIMYKDDDVVSAKSIKEIISLSDKGYTCEEEELKEILLK